MFKCIDHRLTNSSRAITDLNGSRRQCWLYRVEEVDCFFFYFLVFDGDAYIIKDGTRVGLRFLVVLFDNLDTYINQL